MIITDTEEAVAETKLGALIDFDDTLLVFPDTTVIVDEDIESPEIDVTSGVVTASLLYTAEDDMQIGSVLVDSATADFKEVELDSDREIAITSAGTVLEIDTEDDDYVKMTVPEEAVFGNVFISPMGAEIVSGAFGGAVTTTVIQKIQVGSAKLASEVANINAVNAIVVGGPCANAAAATLMGNPEKCWEAIPENKAILKLYESGSNVALLVAGRTALDTRRASRVLANMEDYDLSGMEAEITGTSLSDISVSVPQ